MHETIITTYHVDSFPPLLINALFLLVGILGLVLWLLPTIIAFKIKHPHKIAIMLLNIIGTLFLGLGWIVALIWCFLFQKTTPERITTAQQIKELYELKQKDILSDDEFEKKKKQLLESEPS